MKPKTLFLIIYFSLSISLYSQVNWKLNSVTISGKVIHFENHKDKNAIPFYFREIFANEVQSNYVADIDSLGRFSIEVPFYYPQDFYMDFGNFTRLLAYPGDTLILEIDANVFDQTEEVQAIGSFLKITGGNRVKDNRDILSFINGLPDDQFKYDKKENAFEGGVPEFIQFETQKLNAFTDYFDRFRISNKTSKNFNIWASDYIKYDNFSHFLEYANKKSRKVSDSISLSIPAEYFDFLKKYDNNDFTMISMSHADFLNEFRFYLLYYPTDSSVKAIRLLKDRKISEGARVWQNILLQKTSGFTRNLLLTKFYLDAINGRQIKEFEQLYDSSLITDPFFGNMVEVAYENVKNYLQNQNTANASIKSITGKSVSALIDTISSPYSGKVIYIDFWAPWCSPCMAEMPYSKELQNYYANKDIVFLFLANQCKEDAWKATIANKGLTGEHILLNEVQYAILSQEFKFSGIPHYVLINKNGEIANPDASRPSEKETIIQQIDSLLE